MDRVQVLVNGRQPEALNFTASKTPEKFHDGALRFEETVVKSGLRGILNVMRVLGMVDPGRARQLGEHDVFVAKSAHWVRAPQSGVDRSSKALRPIVCTRRSCGNT